MKRFYFVLLIVFVLSAVLLGLSYSKDTGQYGVPEIDQIVDDKYRIVFSSSDYLTNENLKTDVGLINKSSDTLLYTIKLIPEIGKDVKYSINESEYKDLNDRDIYDGKVASFGTEGDFALNKVAIKCSDRCRVKVEIKSNTKEYLKTIIKNSDNVYEKENTFRYYGENVNNYIKNRGVLYRILKMEAYKVYLISEPTTLGAYKVDGGTYLTLDDYLASFTKGDIKEEEILNNKSWLTSDYVYWLESNNFASVNDSLGIEYSKEKDVHYIRTIILIDGNNAVISGGDGSLDNPYEVSYGSK